MDQLERITQAIGFKIKTQNNTNKQHNQQHQTTYKYKQLTNKHNIN